MAATGLIIRYRLPPGSRGGHGLSIWGWTRHDWGDLHTWFAYATCAFVVIHLILHWKWLMTCAWPKHKWPVIAGLIAGVLLVASVWFFPVERRSRSDRGGGQGGFGHRHGQPGYAVDTRP